MGDLSGEGVSPGLNEKAISPNSVSPPSPNRTPKRASRRASKTGNLASNGSDPTATFIQKLAEDPRFEFFIDMVIMVNFFFLAYETDMRAQEPKGSTDDSAWVDIVNQVFLYTYTCELLVRLAAEKKDFFLAVGDPDRHKWNIFDFIIVVVGLLGQYLDGLSGSVSVLRTFRLLRLLRVVRLLAAFKELWTLLRGLLGCAKTLFWAAILILVALTVWSIFAVEILHPLMEDIGKDGDWDSCGWCSGAFSSVMDSNLTIFQIASGDGWSTLSRPIIKKHPWTALIFFTMIFTMMLGMMNLVTAVIVDNAAQARELDLSKQAEEKREAQERAKDKLIVLCEDLDTDNSGHISIAELHEGCSNSEGELAHMLEVMDIAKEDLDCVFEMLDEDKSGTISPQEFADGLWKMKCGDLRTTLNFVKHYVIEMKNTLKPSLDQIRETQAGHAFANSQALYNLADAVRDYNLDNLAAPLEAAAHGSKSARSNNADAPAAFAMSLPSHALFEKVAAEKGKLLYGHEYSHEAVDVEELSLEELPSKPPEFQNPLPNGGGFHSLPSDDVARPLRTPPNRKTSDSKAKDQDISGVALVSQETMAETVLVAPSCSTPRAAREAVAGPQRRWRPPNAGSTNDTPRDADHSHKPTARPKQQHPHVLPMRPPPTPKAAATAKGCDLLGGSACLGGCPGATEWKEPPHKNLDAPWRDGNTGYG